MPQYLVANYLPDNFDPSTLSEATINAIGALNDELVAAGPGGVALGERICDWVHRNLAYRHDDELIDRLAEQSIAYVPFFPLGGFHPLQSGTLDAVAERLGAARMTVALAWLLHRSPNILLIPGTSSVTHLRENVAAADLALPADALAELDAIAT